MLHNNIHFSSTANNCCMACKLYWKVQQTHSHLVYSTILKTNPTTYVFICIKEHHYQIKSKHCYSLQKRNSLRLYSSAEQSMITEINARDQLCRNEESQTAWRSPPWLHRAEGWSTWADAWGQGWTSSAEQTDCWEECASLLGDSPSAHKQFHSRQHLNIKKTHQIVCGYREIPTTERR